MVRKSISDSTIPPGGGNSCPQSQQRSQADGYFGQGDEHSQWDSHVYEWSDEGVDGAQAGRPGQLSPGSTPGLPR